MVAALKQQEGELSVIEKLKERRDQLKAEHARGMERLAEMEHKVQALKDTLLRISGAIQVLDEQLAAQQAGALPGD